MKHDPETCERCVERARSKRSIQPMKCWIGKEAWRDNLENRPHNAFGYADVIVFTDKDDADQWVDEGGQLRNWVWVLDDVAPRRILKEMPLR